MAKLKEGLKITSAVQLKVCPPINSPFLTGVFRPLILLPHEEYTENEWFFILKHELIHHKRHDIPYKLFILAANMVHWFNPLVWLMVRRSNKDLEISCDDAVITDLNWEERGRYSDTMMAAIINKSPKAPALSTYFSAGTKAIKDKISSLNQAGRKQDEELESLIGRGFPETVSRKQGVLIATKLIPQSVIPQDDLLLALIMNEAKMGQSGISLLVLDHDLNLIGKCDGEIPLSPCYSAQTYRSEGYTITFGCTDQSKWLADSDTVVPVDIQKVKAVYDNGREDLSPVQNNNYICWVKGTPNLVGLYFYNDKDVLQADHMEGGGPGLGRTIK